MKSVSPTSKSGTTTKTSNQSKNFNTSSLVVNLYEKAKKLVLDRHTSNMKSESETIVKQKGTFGVSHKNHIEKRNNKIEGLMMSFSRSSIDEIKKFLNQERSSSKNRLSTKSSHNATSMNDSRKSVKLCNPHSSIQMVSQTQSSNPANQQFNGLSRYHFFLYRK